MNFVSIMSLGLLFLGGTALAADRTPFTAAEMTALLGKGLSVASSDLKGGKEFTGRVDLAAGGKLSGTITPAGQQAVPLSGTWKLKGPQLCRTLGPVQPEEVCETWLKSGPKEATIQVNGKDASVNRWQ
jgi:hypothetical protein